MQAKLRRIFLKIRHCVLLVSRVSKVKVGFPWETFFSSEKTTRPGKRQRARTRTRIRFGIHVGNGVRKQFFVSRTQRDRTDAQIAWQARRRGESHRRRDRVKSIPNVDRTYPMHTPHDDAQDTPAVIYTSVTAVNNRAGSYSDHLRV